MKRVVSCAIKTIPKEKTFDAANHATKLNPANAPNYAGLVASGLRTVILPEHIAVLTKKYWGNGGVCLTVGFQDNPETALRSRILKHMNAWGESANVRFQESSDNPRVRISRTAGAGHWSYLGTDIDLIDQSDATMNLDGFTMSTPEAEFFRVVRHETGHTLGFPHEHMRPEIVSQIDTEEAVKYFGRTQQWSRAEVIAQVLTPLDNSALLTTQLPDENSIMCYWLPASIMKNHKEVAGGVDIDENDATFAALIYPPIKSEK